MFATKSLLVLGLFCVSSVISERVVCGFEDSKCLTETAGLTFEEFIDGVPGVESSEPLREKVVEAKLPTLYYKFTDVTLAGMRKCQVKLVKISAKDLKYDYHVGCPHLVFTAGYEIKGEVGPLPIEGKGDCQIDFYDYLFRFHGDYVAKAGKEGQSHINLKTHSLELVANGKIVYDFKNLFDGDKEKSDAAHDWVNKNYVAVNNGTALPAMGPLMKTFIKHVNGHLDVVSVEKLFSYEK